LIPNLSKQESVVSFTDAEQLFLDLNCEISLVPTEDSFSRWLHDEQPVRIEWSTFGIERLQAESVIQN
jgi:hypothetical protein